MAPLDCFATVWLADFEFHAPEGERPEPLCLVARECRSGRSVRLWRDELLPGTPALGVGADALFVAYYASAELGCFLALGWPLPARVLDLYAEFRCMTSGLQVPCGNGLLGALAYFGLDGVDATDKAGMRELAMRGGPYTSAEREALMAYCESDVVGLAKLLPAMLPRIDVPRALLRGRYMAAAARMELWGVPIDVEVLGRLRRDWKAIQSRLVAAVDADYGVYVPIGRKIDPATKLGEATLQTAAEWGLDPYRLADAVEFVWQREQEGDVEHLAAVAAARSATGLTVNRIAKWERDGERDYSDWPGLDVKARELAAELPALGIGRGYETEAGYDGANYAERLWELLRANDRRRLARHDGGVLRRAAELVAENPEAAGELRPMSFSAARFADWLARNGIPWPRLESGALALDDDTFRQMAKAHAAVAPLRELRHTLSELRLEALAVGSDGRNRCLLSAFSSKTGRNQPSNSKYIFGPSVWLRGLIRPGPGWAVAYIDWEQQEFGIAAALSGDLAMRAAYASGDPYLAFAKQAGAVPADATKVSHKREREQFKVCALAVQYGMGEKSLAQSLGQCEAYARDLLRLHRQTYPQFWRWSESAVNHAMLRGWLQTVFGWRVHVGPDANPRSLANFPMQANGAEMLRLACCLATEQGIRVCAPVHDALLIEATCEEIENAVAGCQAAMREASEIVLAGFGLRTEAKVVRHPERYQDERGVKMWGTVRGILTELADEENARLWDTPPVPQTGSELPVGGTPGQSYVF